MARQLGLNLDTSSLQKSWNPKQETIDETKESDNLGGFDCNICLDTVQDPVITLCGHLYCWPCIYKWIHHQSQPSETSENQEPKCPVCKSEVSEKTMIPLYGPGLTPKPSSDKNGPKHGIAIPQRPPTPRTPSFHHIGPIYHQTLNLNDNLGSRITNLNHHHHLPPHPHHHPPPPANGMFGEMVYSRMFGDSGTTMMAYPNSYNLGVSASPRVRRQIKEVDKSLSRLCFFMFCCLVLCLLLF